MGNSRHYMYLNGGATLRIVSLLEGAPSNTVWVCRNYCTLFSVQ